MFTGFTDDTVQFFLDLKFHNDTTYFHEQHDRYLEAVQKPFYALIDDMAPEMLKIDPTMEIRPYKCLSHIHRDTRFSKDKSPYRDHLWLLFRRAAEPRDKSLFYFVEFGPARLDWGMGFWGENRPAMDLFRRRMQADPIRMEALLKSLRLEKHHLLPGGSIHKRITYPPEVPLRLRRWYAAKDFYIGRENPPYAMAFTEELRDVILDDFRALAPLYRLLRGLKDEIDSEEAATK